MKTTFSIQRLILLFFVTLPGAAQAAPTKQTLVRAQAAESVGPHRINENGKLVQLSSAARIVHRDSSVPMLEKAKNVVSGLEGKSARLSKAVQDGKSSFMKFSRRDWDVAFDKTGSRGWGRRRSVDGDKRQEDRKLDEEALVNIAHSTIARVFPFIEKAESSRFGYEVSSISSLLAAEDSVFGEEVSEGKKIAHIVRVRRTYNGVRFLGPGSFINLEFDLQGNLTGYNLDWSPLKVLSEKAPILDRETVIRKLDQKQLSQGQVSMSVTKSTLRCGYYDVGSYGKKDIPEVDIACTRTLDVQLGHQSRNDKFLGQARYGVMISALKAK